jgi:hypothetical protein
MSMRGPCILRFGQLRAQVDNGNPSVGKNIGKDPYGREVICQFGCNENQPCDPVPENSHIFVHTITPFARVHPGKIEFCSTPPDLLSLPPGPMSIYFMSPRGTIKGCWWGYSAQVQKVKPNPILGGIGVAMLEGKVIVNAGPWSFQDTVPLQYSV